MSTSDDLDSDSARYRQFVSPGHPLVTALLGQQPMRADRLGIPDVLSVLQRHTQSQSVPGRRTFDQLHQDYLQSGAGDGKTRTPLNCIERSTLLVSMLRRIGYSDCDVLVMLGGRRSLGHFHAWAWVVRGNLPYCVDPADLVARPLSPLIFARSHVVHASFNDRRFFVGHGAIAALNALVRPLSAP